MNLFVLCSLSRNSFIIEHTFIIKHKIFSDDVDLVSAMATLEHLSTSNVSKSEEQEFTLENKHEV